MTFVSTSPPRITVIVPTRNSARTLGACLSSIRGQDVGSEIIVVDNHSTDPSRSIAVAQADVVLIEGPERSRQRNQGAAAASGDVLAFLDSDMILEPGVFAEALRLIDAGAGAVVVPERTVGAGFVAQVRAFERSFYLEDSHIEAPRIFRRDIFHLAGGWDESLTGFEDWDLGLRVRPRTTVSRTVAMVVHDEGRRSFREAWRHKAAYAHGIRPYLRKHGTPAAVAMLDRPYLRRPWRLLFPHPLLGLGLVWLKLGETVALGFALLERRHAAGPIADPAEPISGSG